MFYALKATAGANLVGDVFEISIIRQTVAMISGHGNGEFFPNGPKTALTVWEEFPAPMTLRRGIRNYDALIEVRFDAPT